jgi:hypothetical protein
VLDKIEIDLTDKEAAAISELQEAMKNSAIGVVIAEREATKERQRFENIEQRIMVFLGNKVDLENISNIAQPPHYDVKTKKIIVMVNKAPEVPQQPDEPKEPSQKEG